MLPKAENIPVGTVLSVGDVLTLPDGTLGVVCRVQMPPPPINVTITEPAFSFSPSDLRRPEVRDELSRRGIDTAGIAAFAETDELARLADDGCPNDLSNEELQEYLDKKSLADVRRHYYKEFTPRQGASMIVPLGYVQMTNMTVAAALTPPSGGNAQANRVVLQAEAQNVRWRDDGTPPTTTSGNLLRTTDPPLVIEGNDVSKIQVIAATTGAILNVSWYRGRNFTPTS